MWYLKKSEIVVAVLMMIILVMIVMMAMAMVETYTEVLLAPRINRVPVLVVPPI
jgi:hypothetical protein